MAEVSRGLALALVASLASWTFVQGLAAGALGVSTALLAIPAVPLGVIAALRGNRWMAVTTLGLLILAYIPGALLTGADGLELLGFVSLIMALGLIQASDGLFREVVAPLAKGHPLKARMAEAQGRRVLAILISVGVSYLFTVMILYAGLLTSFGLYSEYSAFASSVVVILVVVALAALPVRNRSP